LIRERFEQSLGGNLIFRQTVFAAGEHSGEKKRGLTAARPCRSFEPAHTLGLLPGAARLDRLAPKGKLRRNMILRSSLAPPIATNRLRLFCRPA
jgi:hypothetical protein